MGDFSDVVKAWREIGKTPNGKIVIDDLKEMILVHTFTDQSDLAMDAGAHNTMVELLNWLRGNDDE